MAIPTGCQSVYYYISTNAPSRLLRAFEDNLSLLQHSIRAAGCGDALLECVLFTCILYIQTMIMMDITNNKPSLARSLGIHSHDVNCLAPISDRRVLLFEQGTSISSRCLAQHRALFSELSQGLTANCETIDR